MEKQDFYKLIDALNYVSLTEHLFVTTRSEFEILSVQNINPDHELLTALGTLTIKGVEVFFVELK
jgi:hypothetical protein